MTLPQGESRVDSDPRQGQLCVFHPWLQAAFVPSCSSILAPNCIQRVHLQQELGLTTQHGDAFTSLSSVCTQLFV